MLTDGEMKMKEEENDCVPLAALQVKSSQTTLRRAPQIVPYLITDPSLISLCPYLTSIMSATWLMGYSFLTRWSWYERLWWSSTVQWGFFQCFSWASCKRLSVIMLCGYAQWETLTVQPRQAELLFLKSSDRNNKAWKSGWLRPRDYKTFLCWQAC